MFIINAFIDFYTSNTNEIDYILISFIVTMLLVNIVLLVVFLKIDISQQRSLVKSSEHNLGAEFVTLEFELEELKEGQQQSQGIEGLAQAPDDNTNTQNYNTNQTDNLSDFGSIAGSNLFQSQMFQESMRNQAVPKPDPQLQSALTTLNQPQYKIKDELEEILDVYELEQEEKIRSAQKDQVAAAFKSNLFDGAEEQAEILRNKTVSLWDRVFAEFSTVNTTDPDGGGGISLLFEHTLVIALALTLPSIKNPIMRTKAYPLVIFLCVNGLCWAGGLILKFLIPWYYLLAVSFLVTSILVTLKETNAWSFSKHSFACASLTFIFCFFIIIDMTYLINDFFIFFMFYFKFQSAYTIGLIRCGRFVIPILYVAQQLANKNRLMIAFLYICINSMLFLCMALASNFYQCIQNQKSRFNLFSSTVTIYNRHILHLLHWPHFFTYFFCLLTSFLMVVKQQKFDVSVIALNLFLLGLLLYAINIMD